MPPLRGWILRAAGDDSPDVAAIAGELAERTGRKQPNLSRTLKTMEHYGLVQLRRHKGKLVPRVRYQRVAVLMELKA